MAINNPGGVCIFGTILHTQRRPGGMITAKKLESIKRRSAMGDKGGKKDKEKGQKQNAEKQKKESQRKLDKQPEKKS